MGSGTTAAIFALRNAAPDEWRDVKHTEYKHSLQYDQLTDQQLRAIAAGVSSVDAGLIEGEVVELALQHNETEGRCIGGIGSRARRGKVHLRTMRRLACRRGNLVPITAIARQARRIDRKHRADASFADRRQKPLGTRTADPEPERPRSSSMTTTSPQPRLCALRQTMPPPALMVVQQVVRSRPTNVDIGGARQVVRRDLGQRSPPRPPISSRSPPASPVPAAAPEASARTKERLAALPLRTALAVGDRTSTSTLSPSGFEALRRKLRRQSTQPSSNACGRRYGCYPVNVFGVTEVEYGYRASRFGFRSYMVRSSITHQDVGRYRGLL